MNPFSQLMRDTISLAKANGEVVDNIQCSVQDKKIMVMDAAVDFEEGDLIFRTLPSGRFEEYQVINSKFTKGIETIPDHYTLEVRKKGVITPESKATTINNFTAVNHAAGGAANIASSVSGSASVENTIVNTNNLDPEVKEALKQLKMLIPELPVDDREDAEYEVVQLEKVVVQKSETGIKKRTARFTNILSTLNNSKEGAASAIQFIKWGALLLKLLGAEVPDEVKDL